MESLYKERIALLPGSFDPFTKGHAALVASALRLFDRVVIGVGNNIAKRELLTLEQRVRLIDDHYKDERRVTTQIYNGMTVDFAREIGAVAMVRGVRNTMDLEMERTIEAVNSEIYPELETILLLTPASLAHISSSCVKELLAFKHDISSMMPEGIDIRNYLEK